MRLFAVRIIKDKQPVGFFWADDLVGLWWMIDSVCDPGGCEYQRITEKAAITWEGKVDAKLGVGIKFNEKTGESKEFDRLKAGLSFSYGFEDYVLGSRKAWSKVPYADEPGGGIYELDDEEEAPQKGRRKSKAIDDVGKSALAADLLPETLTDTGFWFLLETSRIATTFHSYSWMAKFIGSSRGLVEEYSEFPKIEENPFVERPDGGMNFYQSMMMPLIWSDEIYLSKIIDALVAYLIDIIACGYKRDPARIPAKAKFDIDHVRKFRTIDEAVRNSAFSEIERISRAGFAEILNEAKRVVNCSVPESVETEIRRFVMLRNSIVHGQGRYREIIGSMFKKRSKGKNIFRHEPKNTAKAELIACRLVEIFEAAALTFGIPVAATKAEVFKDMKSSG